MSFSELGLSDKLVRAVAELGYAEPTPIQRQAIPAILKGGDLLAGAQTGTGKTAGFTLPLLHRLSAAQPNKVHTPHGMRYPVRALVLTPTRELAAQVEESVRAYGKYLPLKSMVMFGGVGINPQIDALKRGVDIVVATPGRLLDHVGQRTIDLSHIELLVLDEADRMLDMGFIHDIRKILNILPPKRQNLLFSATFSDDIRALADRLLDQPALIEVARRNTTAETVEQRIYPVDRERKRELLAKLVRDNDWHQVLVFTRTKHGANRLAEQLTRDGISALAIHGNKSQSARTRALSEFKAGTLRVLVATDIAARGIDIDQLPHVVNFDLPNVPEDYVHRIGRTGRAGAQGEAISLVCVDEHGLLRDIERLIKRELPRTVLEGFEPDPTIAPEPIPNGRNNARGPRQGGGRGQQQPRQANGNAAPRETRAPRAPREPREPRRESSGNGQGQSQGQGQGQGRNGGGRQRQAQGQRDGQAAPKPRNGHGNGNGNGNGQSHARGQRQGNGQGSGQGGQRRASNTQAAQPAQVAQPAKQPFNGLFAKAAALLGGRKG
ncbi:DEAD/DEAH box helicase [Ralstonia solanacearum]|uniref:DEAD/DEAH box helicase n=1 Tax=Ralstonia solanacearum TaxID=305 RepID=UPI0005C759B4|nr:DEAD/DEAH box helicase [Ralstonia solanacearum]MBB6591993.1 DEAD/DEAH box helicase [Ralstonia solanacearum]MBB6596216.1 DEAD/DEAH box helicase [Ralstonia solanacearum]MDB0542023.1 DEAD/DEAH box helicase [Ralstonia solanacearum]MDB0552309.1 DEAD/DEAH box helicase [Ralstonia solanacearum]MDB0556925.1 DEAD/DEAH box helicase [Ralstonia solanacearum]